MADENMTPEEKAKKDREEAVKEQDNPPQPWPTPEDLNKVAQGEPLPESAPEDETPAQKAKREADAKAAAEKKAAEAGGPAKYQTR